MRTRQHKLTLNLSLLIGGTLSSFSGLILQIGFHLGTSSETNKISKVVGGLTYNDWQVIHKASIVLFLIAALFHLYKHRNCYVNMWKKHILNRHKQVILFSTLFVFSSITGLTAWMIDTLSTKDTLRVHFIEIHDKVSFILILFFASHCIQRAKRLL